MASDILTVENYLFNGLLSCDLFAEFNVVQERKFLAQSEVEFDAIWQQPRPALNGLPAGRLVGAGLYVEMPKLHIPKPNSLQRNLLVSVAAIEERNINMTATTGTGASAEELAEMALDFMFGWVLSLSSGLTPEDGAVTPANDLIEGDGLVCYRATVSLRRERKPQTRCDKPTLADAGGGNYTLTNGAGTPDADIYYTTGNAYDGAEGLSFPGKANGAAVKYAGPIALTAGQAINWAAWRADLLPSHLGAASIT